jgi:hypothetical protein
VKVADKMKEILVDTIATKARAKANPNGERMVLIDQGDEVSQEAHYHFVDDAGHGGGDGPPLNKRIGLVSPSTSTSTPRPTQMLPTAHVGECRFSRVGHIIELHTPVP